MENITNVNHLKTMFLNHDPLKSAIHIYNLPVTVFGAGEDKSLEPWDDYSDYSVENGSDGSNENDGSDGSNESDDNNGSNESDDNNGSDENNGSNESDDNNGNNGSDENNGSDDMKYTLLELTNITDNNPADTNSDNNFSNLKDYQYGEITLIVEACSSDDNDTNESSDDSDTDNTDNTNDTSDTNERCDKTIIYTDADKIDDEVGKIGDSVEEIDKKIGNDINQDQKNTDSFNSAYNINIKIPQPSSTFGTGRICNSLTLSSLPPKQYTTAFYKLPLSLTLLSHRENAKTRSVYLNSKQRQQWVNGNQSEINVTTDFPNFL